jgi:2-phospho-L-lactate guanylyltransferase
MIAAVVPMKPFARAKQRLSGVLAEPERLRLVRAMLGDVLAALRECDAVAQTFVVTADPAIARYAAGYGAEHFAEGDPTGLNGAVATAARALEARGVETMLVLPGDVPLVIPAEIDELASLARPCSAGIVPDHDAKGTNALLLSPPGVIAPAFGPGSYERHVATARTAGLEAVICALEGLGRDIDAPEDLPILAERTADRPEYDFLRAALTDANLKEPQNA